MAHRWLASGERAWKPATVVSYRRALAPVRGVLGARLIQELRKSDIETMVAMIEAASDRPSKTHRSPRTVAYSLLMLRMALDGAVVDELIRRNPAEHVKPPKQEPREMATWTASEVQRFLTHVADDPLAGVWHLTALGMRRGEVLGVRWGDVDLDAGVVHVRQARVQAGREVVTGRPKTDRGRRDVPLHPAAVEALKRTRQATVVGSAVVPLRAKRDDSRLIAVDAAGEPLTPQAYSTAFQQHAEAAGLPRIRLHDVRHTAATLMLAQGVPPVTVAGVLGHSPDVLLRVYAHALPEAKRDAVNLLGALYAAGA
ncbi:MAG: tyrosine-type recombinase/integrase [Protaetiibacter sp.]